MEKFKLSDVNDEVKWVCCGCGSSDIADHSPEPNIEEVYQEVPDGSGDTIEKLVPVATEHYLSLECNVCHETEFEAL